MLENYRTELKKRWKDKTQTNIAIDSGISQSYITKLISGKAPIEKLSVGNFLKLFPNALQETPQEQLTAAERKLLDLFRQMTEEGQLETLLQIAAILPQYKSQTQSA